jgi:NitT/TauT family transport system substrate-binding protein
MTNLTHAPLLAAIRDGSLARAIGPNQLQVTYFRSGPRVTEALLGGALDLATAGPGPLITTLSRHPRSLVALCGVASGGASLVVRAPITDLRQLQGATLAVAQIGSTHEVSLRTFIRRNGLSPQQTGGSVRITALAPADILTQLKQGGVDGAWLAEPWATRSVSEGQAVRMVDERDLWPDRYFPSALLIARRDFLATRSVDAAAAEGAVRQYVMLAQTDAAQVRTKAYEELILRVKNPGARPVFDEAWRFVDFRCELREPTLATLRQNAIDAGLLQAR